MSGRLTPEQRHRVIALRRDGVPASWIAEDVGAHITTIPDVCRAVPAEVAAWRSDFQYIRRNPVLFALHTEFAPKKRRGGTS